jgi:copper transport protein
VLSPSGKPVQQGKPITAGDAASVDVDAAEPGTYVVDWQVASEDTHPVRGQFAFSVGQPSNPPALASTTVGDVAPIGLALQALGRWLHFAGYALAFGTLAVTLLLSRAPPLSSPASERPTDTGPALGRMINSGIVLLLLAEPLALLGQTGSLGLDQMLDGDTLGDALASPFGRLLGFRLAAVLLLWVVSGSLGHSDSPARPTPSEEQGGPDLAGSHPHAARGLAAGAALALGLALAIIDGLGQHAGSFQPEWLGLIVHAVHLIGMALWIGALAVVLWAWRSGKPKARAAKIAVGAFALVAASGVAMALVHFPQPSDLVTTAYGQVLAGKQVLLLAAAGLALFASKRPRGRLAELGALTVLIGLAGLLVSLPPPR